MSNRPIPPMPRTISARELQQTEFPPVSWVVEGLIPEGLTLFAGKPKLGKSWLALDAAHAVATGGDVLGRAVGVGWALYLALEDNPRRLQARLAKIVDEGGSWPDNLHVITRWARLDEGGLEHIEEFIDAHPHCKLVVIDTLATVRPATKANESQYSGDYAALRGLHRIAAERGVAVVVVHHVRKSPAEDDPFDAVSGSTGLTGAADTTLILTKGADGCVLYGRGRDLEQIETAVEFDAATCRWNDKGDPSRAFAGDTRQAIFEAMEAGMQTPTMIAETAGLQAELCKKTLQRMADRGDIERESRGCYRLRSDPLSPLSPCPQGMKTPNEINGQRMNGKGTGA